MAANKNIINTRFANKSDTSANWNIASNAAKPFIPLKGEIIFYTDLNMIKIGDGETVVGELDFLAPEAITTAEIDEICSASIYPASEVEF